MKQSTFSAQVANNLLTVLQGYSKTIRLLLVMLLTLTASTAWGADVVYKTAKFGSSYNSAKVSSYTSSWYSTYNGFRVDIVNANNNQNGWEYIKMGSKSAALTGTITTNAKIDAAITKVSLKIDAITTSKITSITLKKATSSDGTYEDVGTFTKSTGTQTVTLDEPTANFFYKIEVVCAQGSSNGLIQISQVDYYKSDVVSTCTTNPTVSAGSNSSVTTTTATVSCSGGITSLGSAGCSIESYGFVYGTSSNPTISNSKVQVGTTYTTTGTAFTKELTGLTANTTYYVRPYATNGNGTAYGTQTSFKTLELPKYTVTLDAGPGTCAASVTETSAGAGVTLPTPTLDCGDWTFAGWKTTSAVTTETTTEPTLIPAGAYSPTSDITFYAVYQRTETTSGGGGGGVATVVDTLTHSINGRESSNTSYVEFSNKTYTSEAKYAGSTSNGNNNTITGVIQIRSSSSNTGIITTASGGKVKKVIVVWDSGTTSGRTLDVYGKNSPYDAVGDLYSSDAATKGTKLGSIVCGNSTELNITEDYEYIGLRSASNAMYLTSIAITWESTTGGSGSTTYYHSTPDCGSTPDPIGYTITYNTNGGDAIAATSGTALPNPLPTPTRQHYTFVGWYTDESRTQAATAGATIDADITLYAKWTPKVYLTILHPQDGVLLDTNGTQQDSIIIEYVYGTSAVDIPVANYYQSITRDGYKFKGWYNAPSEGSKWLNIAQGKNQNLWAQWLEERTVTYYSIGQVYDTQTYGSGETLTLPTTNPTACDGYTFVGWTTAEQSETTTKPTLVSNTTVVSSDMILYAVNSGVAETKTDILTRSLTGVSGTTYTAWSGKTATSSAVYAGQSAGGNEAIQLRSKESSSGIVTTTSGGKVTKVEVEWHSGTSSGRTLDVYGKNSEYSDATDLYNTSSQGTKLGSIIYGTSTELEITGDYEYVGLRSKDGAMYLSSISITWLSGSTTIYTTSPNCCPVNLEKPQVAYSVADGAVTLNWTMVNNESDVADYTVACVGGEIHTTTATSYTFTGLTNCAEYTFTVKANGDGTDVCSSGVTAVTATPAAGSFTVTFDYGAGEGTPTQWTSGCANGTSTTLPTPTTLPDNHTFEGWYDGTNLYVAGDNYTPTSDVTLYARYTREVAVDIVEWDPNSVTVEIGVGGSVQVQIENEVEHGLGVGSAEGLFFSKYFEGSGSLKLLAIYNGTGKDIDLSTYKIDRGSNGDATNISKTYDLSQLGTIKNGQEIIFYSWPRPASGNNEAEYSYECSRSFLESKANESRADDNPRWILCDATAHNGVEFETMDFSGDDPLLLYKGNSLIDVFGVSTAVEQPTKKTQCEGRSENSWSADGVTNMDYGKTEADFEGGVVPEGVDLINPTITAYTARVIMFRKNTVTSGSNAVTKNTTDFVTFADEWEARTVCKSGDDGDLTCAAYQELGVFDYSVYYVSYDSLTRVDLGGNKNADGTYTIPVPQLDTLSCTKMRIQVLDNNGVSLASSEYKVPIMVKSSGVTTTDELFSKHGIEGCRDCDVVILKNATLQKASDGTANDMPEVRDMEVYAGGKLVVPNGTNYTMRKLVMRSKGDEVPVAEIDGTAVISDKLYHAKRIDAQKFYFFTLPYDCAVSDITYYNGEVLGARGIDYVIKYYDGEGRANGQNAGHWEEFTGATLKAGVGYILAVDASLNGDFDDNPKKEFLFPMTKMLTENSDKTVAVCTWGIGDATIGDNHKGWNLIGTPFMSHYNPISATGLKVGTYTDGEWNSEGTIFTYNESVTVPYVTMPNADGKTYTQRLASSQDLEPFKSFFIQVGKEGDVITDVAFSSAERLSKAPHRAPAVDATVWVELELKNTSGSDFTTIILDENCTADYEIGADLEKMLGYAALPQFYSLQSNARLAFNALPSEFASVSIPLGFYAPKSDTYTIALNTEKTQNLEGVYLTDNVTGTITNLLLDDYTFSSAKVLNETRFSIAVVRAVTAVDNVLAENDLVSIVNSYDLHIKNAPIGSELRVYDTLGREVISDQIDVEQKIYHLHTAGVYHVQIISKDKKSVYKVVSY